jgi:hypothetical protein
VGIEIPLTLTYLRQVTSDTMNMYSMARIYSVPRSGVLTTSNIVVQWDSAKNFIHHRSLILFIEYV